MTLPPDHPSRYAELHTGRMAEPRPRERSRAAWVAVIIAAVAFYGWIIWQVLDAVCSACGG